MNFVQYKNGNYDVFIDLDSGTKIRKNDLDFFDADTVESMDIKITNMCDNNCSFCLKSDAKLFKKGNDICISDVKLDDLVLSYNTELNSIEYKKVNKLYQRYYNGELISITDNRGNKIICTPNHKIFTTNRGYVRADEIQINDSLICV